MARELLVFILGSVVISVVAVFALVQIVRFLFFILEKIRFALMTPEARQEYAQEQEAQEDSTKLQPGESIIGMSRTTTRSRAHYVLIAKPNGETRIQYL